MWWCLIPSYEPSTGEIHRANSTDGSHRASRSSQASNKVKLCGIAIGVGETLRQISYGRCSGTVSTRRYTSIYKSPVSPRSDENAIRACWFSLTRAYLRPRSSSASTWNPLSSAAGHGSRRRARSRSPRIFHMVVTAGLLRPLSPGQHPRSSFSVAVFRYVHCEARERDLT